MCSADQGSKVLAVPYLCRLHSQVMEGKCGSLAKCFVMILHVIGTKG